MLRGQVVRGSTVLTTGAGGTWEETSVYGPGAVVRVASNDQRMWYEGFGGADLGGGDLLTQTGYATSTDGLTWSKYGSNPVLVPGTSSIWENNEASISSVVYNPSGSPANFEAWYHGGNNTGGSGGGRAIGYATSSDGITWSKYGSNPVLTKGGAGTWDGQWAADAKVIKFGDNDYRMWYGGTRVSDGKRQIGYATSSNGTSWSKYGSNPVLTWGGGGAWDEGDIEAFCPYFDLSTLTWHAWYVAHNAGASTSGIGYAYSTDGITWTKGPYNPVEYNISGDLVTASIHAWLDGTTVRIMRGLFNSTGPQRYKRQDSIAIEQYVPSGVLIDSFPVDGGPPPNSKWNNGVLSFTGGEGLVVLSGQLTRKSTGSTGQDSYYSASTFGPEVCLIFDIPQYTTTGYGLKLYARITTPGSGTTDGYVLNTWPDDGTIELWRLDNAVETAITETLFKQLAAGGQIAIMCIGSTISGWYRATSTDSWDKLVQATDATYTSAGYVGAYVYGGQGVRLDNMTVGPNPGQGLPVFEAIPFMSNLRI